MKISELFDLSLPYHDKLCPKIWSDLSLKENVRQQLLAVADEFIQQLKIDESHITDIIMTGSLANYNWSKYSDIDLHIVVEGLNDELYKDYFKSKQIAWNMLHDITSEGHDVEVYVHDPDEPHHSSGVYSILNDMWLVKPTHEQPDIDKASIKRKVHLYADKIDNLSGSCHNREKLLKLKDKIKNMRQTGLDKNGEFSTENLVYKVLRNNGLIDKLYDSLNKSLDACLSL